jgi:DNA-binding MarR family transcriptional regulator
MPAPQPQPEEPAELLARTAFTVMAVLTRLAAEHDLSLTQLRVFGILRDRTPRMAELADFLGLERSTMSGLVARAERRGLVRRIRDPHDARATGITMTEAGHDLAERVLDQVRTGLGPLTDRLTDEERRALSNLLTRLLPPTAT